MGFHCPSVPRPPLLFHGYSPFMSPHFHSVSMFLTNTFFVPLFSCCGMALDGRVCGSMVPVFAGASSFNGDVSKWDTASVTTLYYGT